MWSAAASAALNERAALRAPAPGVAAAAVAATGREEGEGEAAGEEEEPDADMPGKKRGDAEVGGGPEDAKGG